MIQATIGLLLEWALLMYVIFETPKFIMNVWYGIDGKQSVIYEKDVETEP